MTEKQKKEYFSDEFFRNILVAAAEKMPALNVQRGSSESQNNLESFVAQIPVTTRDAMQSPLGGHDCLEVASAEKIIARMNSGDMKGLGIDRQTGEILLGTDANALAAVPGAVLGVTKYANPLNYWSGLKAYKAEMERGESINIEDANAESRQKAMAYLKRTLGFSANT